MYATEERSIPPKCQSLIGTGIAIQIPQGCYGRIASRSSLASKHNIEVGAGVIDRDYRGEIFVLLRNFGSHPFTVEKNQCIAQLILERNVHLPLQETKQLSSTIRGNENFGSSDTICAIETLSSSLANAPQWLQ